MHRMATHTLSKWLAKEADDRSNMRIDGHSNKQLQADNTRTEA